MRADRHAGPRLGLILAAVLGVGLFASAAAAGPKAVLELFTSQGCSSCPPADDLLAEYAAKGDVVALSFSVDYWDYLGWADTLATRDNTARQRAYAAARGDRQVYTPQMVIDGKEHVVGSDRGAVERAISHQAGDTGLPINIRLTSTEDSVTVAVDGAPADTPMRGTLWLAVIDAERFVRISRGENTGKTLIYRNVVRKMQRIAMWKGKPVTLDLPRSEMRAAKADGCAVLLQTETDTGLPGKMLGAAMIRYRSPDDYR